MKSITVPVDPTKALGYDIQGQRHLWIPTWALPPYALFGNVQVSKLDDTNLNRTLMDFLSFPIRDYIWTNWGYIIITISPYELNIPKKALILDLHQAVYGECILRHVDNHPHVAVGKITDGIPLGNYQLQLQ